MGDFDKVKDMEKHEAVEKKVKLMMEKKLKVVKGMKVYDESEKIFEPKYKKGKEKEKFMQRNAL